MESERWQKVERLYHAVLECEENGRAAFLARACEGDEGLRQEVESLVSYGSRSGKFIEGSALDVVAPVLAGDEGDGQDPASAESRMVGRRISQYSIVEQLGSGGMGEVYRAVRADDQYQKQVAIKFVRAGADSGLVIGRFKNERQILAGLDHPNIARLLDGGVTEDGVPYFVMELVEGQPIDKYCDSYKLGIRGRLELFLQVCSALKYSHQHQIIHRDIKPANILVTAEGVPKLLDFGIAKMVDSGLVAGAARQTQTMFRVFTPEYASPEQIKAEPINAASDVYSLGVLLYELLTGHGPYRFKTRTPAEIERAICEEEPIRPSVSVRRAEQQTRAGDKTTSIASEEICRTRDTDPRQLRSSLAGDLDAIVLMALRKEPDRRYASVEDFSDDIRKHLDGLPIGARPSTVAYRGAKFVRRHKELVVGVVVFLVVLAGLALVRKREVVKQSPEPGREVVSRQLTANVPENSVLWATVSRDGKYLAYCDRSDKLYLLQIDNGALRQLPHSGFTPLDWFPDGNHLLVTGAGQHSGLWKMSVSDGASQKLSDIVGVPVISPDGSQLAYPAGNEIWVMGADGRAPHMIAKFDAVDSIDWLTWSPGGQRLAYTRHAELSMARVVIETCDLRGGQRTLVLSEPKLWAPNGVSDIFWLADGRILYNLPDSSLSNYSEHSMWAIATDPGSGKVLGSPVRLTNGGNAFTLQASADGKRIIYRYLRSKDSVYVGNLERGAGKFHPRRLTLEEWNNWPFDWTRDGKAVLFRSLRSAKNALLQQRIDQQTPEVLLSDAESYQRPALSPAGDRLLYTASPTSGPWDASKSIMSKPVNGGAFSVLMAGEHPYHCGAVPSAGCVVSEAQGEQLVFFNLDPVAGKGAEIQRLDMRHGGDWSVTWALSADGRKIAIVDPAGTGRELRILTLADHEFMTVTLQDAKWDNMQSVAWSANASHLVVTAFAGGSWAILLVDMHGRVQVLTEMESRAAWLSGLVPSPDGHYLAFMKRTYESNVVMLEHF